MARMARVSGTRPPIRLQRHGENAASLDAMLVMMNVTQCHTKQVNGKSDPCRRSIDASSAPCRPAARASDRPHLAVCSLACTAGGSAGWPAARRSAVLLPAAAQMPLRASQPLPADWQGESRDGLPPQSGCLWPLAAGLPFLCLQVCKVSSVLHPFDLEYCSTIAQLWSRSMRDTRSTAVMQVGSALHGFVHVLLQKVKVGICQYKVQAHRHC